MEQIANLGRRRHFFQMINAQVVLSPKCSKRLIAKAVLESDYFKRAIEKGIVVLSLGTTNAFIYEEFTGNKIAKEKYSVGIITDVLTVSESAGRIPALVLKRGEVLDIPWREALPEMDQNSLFIKGANAYDTTGLAGVLVGGEAGGTIGQALGTLVVNKVPLMIPVGLEKRVPSVKGAAQLLSEPHVETKNMNVGMFVVTNGLIIDEIRAFEILFGLEAALIAAGGFPGFEGSVVINLKGTEAKVVEALELVESLKL